jgi:DNA repair exonuclease SbcCD ATPase subunit
MEAIQQIQAIIHDKQSATMQHLNSLDAIEKYIQKVNIELDDLTREDGDIERERTDLVLHETKRVQLEQEREDLLNERALYDVSKSILQDDGIKTRIIKQYLPIINKLVNRYLHEMDFFVSFDLDETFIETIKSRHRDSFTYSSFSEGEKMRIDLALLFTWRAVAKLKNSTNTNLLILDEVFDSSLDTDGTDTFMKIIYEMGETANVFVISHKGDQLYDKFKSIIRFEKKNNCFTIS